MQNIFFLLNCTQKKKTGNEYLYKMQYYCEIKEMTNNNFSHLFYYKKNQNEESCKQK